MAAFCDVYLNITNFLYNTVINPGVKWARALPLYSECGGVL